MNKIRVDKIEALTLLASFWNYKLFELKFPVSPKILMA